MTPAGATDPGAVVSCPGRRLCEWCSGPIPAGMRKDARYCSTLHRQAAHRFGRPMRRGGPARRVGEPMRFAYADPPYPGLSAKYYGDHPDFGGEVDHVELVARLVDEFPDGWALSTSAAARRSVEALCPAETRLCIWVNGERPGPSWGPLNAYEAVLVAGGRPIKRAISDRVTDVLVHGVTARTTDPGWVTGSKPAEFCRRLFDWLGAQPGDELVDLFPGSGGVSRAWEIFSEAGR